MNSFRKAEKQSSEAGRIYSYGHAHGHGYLTPVLPLDLEKRDQQAGMCVHLGQMEYPKQRGSSLETHQNKDKAAAKHAGTTIRAVLQPFVAERSTTQKYMWAQQAARGEKPSADR